MWSSSWTGLVRLELKQALKLIFGQLRYFPITLKRAPVQVEFLAASDPPNLTATINSVVNSDKITGGLNLGPELDAGHLAGDVRHRLQGEGPALGREGAIELVFHHT